MRTSSRQVGQPPPSWKLRDAARGSTSPLTTPTHCWIELKDKVVVVEPLFDTPYGTRKFTRISDPDGNELGFVRDSADS